MEVRMDCKVRVGDELNVVLKITSSEEAMIVESKIDSLKVKIVLKNNEANIEFDGKIKIINDDEAENLFCVLAFVVDMSRIKKVILTGVQKLHAIDLTRLVDRFHELGCMVEY